MKQYTKYLVVPSPVQDVMVKREKQRKLNISWEEPEEPNDYNINYTITITDIRSGSKFSKKFELGMQQLTVVTEVLGKTIYKYNVITYQLP